MTIEINLTFKGTIEDLFQYWTNKSLLKKWIAPFNDQNTVNPKKNGKYWLYISENHNTYGCKILSINPNESLEFTWKGPKEFDDFLNFDSELTTVKIILKQLNSDKVSLSLVHFGWKSSEDYQKAREWHLNFWQNALRKLENQIEN